jgi:hypothetical protein
MEDVVLIIIFSLIVFLFFLALWLVPIFKTLKSENTTSLTKFIWVSIMVALPLIIGGIVLFNTRV